MESLSQLVPGPLLFVVYINDMPSRVRNSSLVIFADDAKCRRSTIGDCELMQDILTLAT